MKCETCGIEIEKFNQLCKLGFQCFILRHKHWEQAKEKGKLTFKRNGDLLLCVNIVKVNY